MIRATVGKIGRNLEEMITNQMPIGTVFEILSRRADTIEEQVVLEVMRESFAEMCCDEQRLAS